MKISEMKSQNKTFSLDKVIKIAIEKNEINELDANSIYQLCKKERIEERQFYPISKEEKWIELKFIVSSPRSLLIPEYHIFPNGENVNERAFEIVKEQAFNYVQDCIELLLHEFNERDNKYFYIDEKKLNSWLSDDNDETKEYSNDNLPFINYDELKAKAIENRTNMISKDESSEIILENGYYGYLVE